MSNCNRNLYGRLLYVLIKVILLISQNNRSIKKKNYLQIKINIFHKISRMKSNTIRHNSTKKLKVTILKNIKKWNILSRWIKKYPNNKSKISWLNWCLIKLKFSTRILEINSLFNKLSGIVIVSSKSESEWVFFLSKSLSFLFMKLFTNMIKPKEMILKVKSNANTIFSKMTLFAKSFNS